MLTPRKARIVKVAIVGSRKWTDEKRIVKYIKDLPKDSVIVSGGAQGVDQTAIYWAKFFALETKVYLPDWNKHGKSAGMIRNSLIVEDCDRLVAFWNGKSKGTKDSIDKARKAGKPVEVIES